MSIQARIHAFESIGKDAPNHATVRKPPIDIYGSTQEEQEPTNGEKKPISAMSTGEGSGDKLKDDEAHNLIVGSITSDFVKVSPPRSKAPPLPPRRTSETTASTPSTPSMDGDSINYSPKNELYLKSPQTPRPIPLKTRTLGPTSGGLKNGRGHTHAVSSSSFHSVSLSDQGDGEHDDLEHELGGSYEAVSPHASSVFSLVDNSKTSSPALSATSLAPPALPPRPSASPAEPQQISVNYAVRKVPPPPSNLSQSRSSQPRSHKPAPLDDVPQRTLTRSSLTSLNSSRTISPSNSTVFSYEKRSPRTSTSTVGSNFNLPSLAKKRPPPLPPNARARYDAVFEANITMDRERTKLSGKALLKPSGSSRRAVGWRGTSVDLTTVGAADVQSEKMTNPLANEAEEEWRLSGKTVKLIWQCSRLPRGTLRTIWNECDPQKTGSLDKQSFANGMWRIDNELLVALSVRTTSAGPSHSATRSSFIRR
ncbi:hypothetical protein M408DRAFT_327823 [Serendipita vermifera MAFF 305830]|uniref:EH domain-containing protein n=1 Tax=Serendipita vermifera MAFF 305830 TaxID=933852 RepID=A0A0C3BFE8_SERVB|nr:hypothetical protein M408DRAFT_327823 [Serendipita vermifera MAFF 305830]